MEKHIYNIIVRFSGITDFDGNPIHDWHDEYLNMAGMLSVYESENTVPGKRYVLFFPNEPDSEMQRYFKTLAGEMMEFDDMIILEEESIYTFEIGDYVSDDDKALLWINVFFR